MSFAHVPEKHTHRHGCILCIGGAARFTEYRGKPIIVGGSPEGRGGVVATPLMRRANLVYALPCLPNAQRNHVRLRSLSNPASTHTGPCKNRSGNIFALHDLIEPLSLDEAFLDVTTDKAGIGSAIQIAEAMRKAISDELQLTASAGVSINKFVATLHPTSTNPMVWPLSAHSGSAPSWNHCP